MTAVDAEISLRPLSLRPGGANPFAGFAKGAGAGLKNKAVTSQPVEERRKKPAGEVIRYSRDFLMKFVQKYTRVPQELQYSNSDILLAADDPGREQQQQLLQRVAADEADERDWRARSTLPPAPASAQQQQQQQQPPQQPQPGWRPDQQPSSSAAAPTPAAGGPEVAKVQRATDIGRTAWHAGEVTEGADQTLRKVKGILNKLTPEKFERLLSQLIPMVSGYEVLQGTIHQVFENAVQQPTFVAMYADLCRELDAVLPEFRAPGEDKPTGFKKMLANTCQAEYEATEEARKLKSLPAEERYDAERRAKQRLLGNIRLIAELFNKAQVNDRIMLLILADLLGGPDNDPPEDSVEAVCELLAIAGAELEKGAKGKARLDAAFRQVERMSNATKAYASRIRFVMKDVLELRHQHWVARRETFTAKKLDDIRSEAQAELGIVDMPIAGLESLAGSLPPLAAKRAEEVDLFPAFKSSEAGWAAARGKGEAAGTQKFSAFLGDYVAVAHEVAAVAAPVSTARAPRTDLSDDERQSLGKSLFSDYLSSPDLDEAVGTAQELEAPGFQHKLVQIGLEKAFDAMTEKEQLSLVDLLAALAARGVLAADDLKQGTAALLEQLEDLALDIPSAPRLLGRLLGAAAAGGLLGLDWVAGAASGCESAEPRRAYVAAVLKAVAEAGGEEQLVAACGEAKLDLASLLAFDAEFDGDLEAPADFLRAQGLPAIA